jgi:hypothetical protein
MWVIKQFQGSLSSDPAGFAYWQAYDDACSEARLRGEEPPFPTPEQWELVQQYLSTRLKDPAVLAIFEAIEGEHIKQVIQTLADPHRRNDEQRNGRLVGRCAAQAPPLTMHLRSHARASWVPLPKVFFSMRIRPIISSFV